MSDVEKEVETVDYEIVEEVSGVKPDSIWAQTSLKFSISHNYNTFGGEIQMGRSTNRATVTEEELQTSVTKAAFKELDNVITEFKTRTKGIKQTILDSQK